jgi:FMN phosphatase YigB (HAD superfamily)
MVKQRILLTDVDNTLFSWIDFFAPCFRALVHAVSRESGIPEETLYDAFQVTFKREGSVEYRRAIQGNLAIQALPDDEQKRLVELGHKVFSIAMRRNLRPYDGVKPTLDRLQLDGVRIVAVTNSGGLQAVHRLRQLGLAKYLSGLIAWDHDVAQLADSHEDYQLKLYQNSTRSGLPWMIAIPSEQLKPSPVAYTMALERLGAMESDVWILGDSLEKDLSAASSLGAMSIWAKYGHGFDQRNFDTLLRITHWSAEKIEKTYDTDILKPDAVIASFTELLDIVGLSQGELF